MDYCAAAFGHRANAWEGKTVKYDKETRKRQVSFLLKGAFVIISMEVVGVRFETWLTSEEAPLRAVLEKLFEGFPPDAPVALMECGAGGEIIRQDDACGHVYVLLEGRVAASGIQPGYTNYAFSEFDAVEFFGEYEILSGAPRFLAQVRAKTGCRLLRIPASGYMQWVMSESAVLLGRCRRVLKGLIDQAARERSFLFLDSDSRLMQFLTLYYERNPAKGRAVVDMTRAAICEETGFCVRTANRSVKRLEEGGLLSIRKGKITLTARQYAKMQAELKRRLDS